MNQNSNPSLKSLGNPNVGRRIRFSAASPSEGDGLGFEFPAGHDRQAVGHFCSSARKVETL
jgi:hypothetical protein